MLCLLCKLEDPSSDPPELTQKSQALQHTLESQHWIGRDEGSNGPAQVPVKDLVSNTQGRKYNMKEETWCQPIVSTHVHTHAQPSHCADKHAYKRHCRYLSWC